MAHCAAAVRTARSALSSQAPSQVVAGRVKRETDEKLNANLKTWEAKAESVERPRKL